MTRDVVEVLNELEKSESLIREVGMLRHATEDELELIFETIDKLKWRLEMTIKQNKEVYKKNN